MAEHAITLGATKKQSTLLVLFIPSKDRFDEDIDQARWVDEALAMLGKLFHGATAFPQGQGVWRDDAQGGILLFDNPVIIQCYTSDDLLETHGHELRAFLVQMGKETKQGAIGLVIDRDYLEITFELAEKGA